MRVLVVDHEDSYTWNLVHLIASVTGSLPAVAPHGTTDFDGFSHLVLSPGPGHPAEYSWPAFSAGLPVLGVCLGMQALVAEYGGTVDRIPPAHGEVAVVRHDDRGVFAGLPQDFRAVRYHSLAATAVPGTLEVTARSGEVVMGIRHRVLPLEGVQFHPESILSEYGARLIGSFLS